jgi:glucans biosynthesis protein C
VASTIAVLRPKEKLAKQQSQRDLSIDYLRTTLTLMVVAHHSALAYTSFTRSRWQDMIVSDVTRSAFFDYATSFDDVFLMALMFFVSGLFVYPSLRRRGAAGFIRERSLRLGVPFVFSVAFLVPIADYASWRLTGHDTGFIAFYKILATRGFGIGPPWFLWELLFFDVVLASSLAPVWGWMPLIERSTPKLRNHPLAACLGQSLCLAAFLSNCAHWPLCHTVPFRLSCRSA